MIVIPAIDIRQKKSVMLTRGLVEGETIYSDDASRVAESFVKDGAERLHIVDLDAALSFDKNNDVNRDVILSIRKSVKDSVIEIGGGIRTADSARRIASAGFDYIIMGTSMLIPIAMEEGFTKNDIKLFYQQSGKVFDEEKEIPEVDLIEKIGREFKEKVIISVDYRKDEVALSGWEVTIPLTPYYAIKKFLKKGFKRFIITNVERDGTLNGVDVSSVESILKKIYCFSERPDEIIVSGGITTEADIEALQQMKYRPDGVIIGKALYQDKMNIRTLVKKFQEGQDA